MDDDFQLPHLDPEDSPEIQAEMLLENALKAYPELQKVNRGALMEVFIEGVRYARQIVEFNEIIDARPF